MRTPPTCQRQLIECKTEQTATPPTTNKGHQTQGVKGYGISHGHLIHSLLVSKGTHRAGIFIHTRVSVPYFSRMKSSVSSGSASRDNQLRGCLFQKFQRGPTGYCVGLLEWLQQKSKHGMNPFITHVPGGRHRSVFSIDDVTTTCSINPPESLANELKDHQHTQEKYTSKLRVFCEYIVSLG